MPGRTSRYVLAGLVLAWVAAAAILLRGWAPGTYLALELIWLLPPIIAQVALGAGILWQQRRLVSAALFAPLLYLSAADSIAISAGIWTISPRQTTGFLVGGALPLEEFIFFLLTNVLIVFGMTLFMTLPLVVVWPWRRNELPRSVSEHEAKAQ